MQGFGTSVLNLCQKTWKGLLVSGFLLACVITPAPAKAIEVGESAPPFKVYAGEKETIQLSDFFGKVIILTYESKDMVDKNSKFKEIVTERFLRNKERDFAIVPVISCFEFFWPLKRFCMTEVQRNAGRLRLRLYVDRTGDMFSDYSLKKKESNAVIIDKRGIIRYIHSGKIDEEDIPEVIGLAEKLEKEQAVYQ